MDRVRHNKPEEREFDGFAAEAWDPLLRTGYLMTGDAGDAEDLVQETLLSVARRWDRVRSMDHPAAYARRVLINLGLHDAGRRSRQRAELWPQDGGAEAADQSAARALGQVDDLAEFRWTLAQRTSWTPAPCSAPCGKTGSRRSSPPAGSAPQTPSRPASRRYCPARREHHQCRRLSRSTRQPCPSAPS